ncbi:hypothetical protein [Dactylosporangium sp. NPDC049140]|uniref:hypothetical protein n=1 Tax=Dactylosporangium sp. NPDC049140 TaxID=3155647 RepID=UPI0033E8BE92
MNMRELFRRFRPAGTPGAAAPAAVPDDPARRGAAELGRVFAALAGANAEAAGVRAAAARAAEQLDRDAATEAARIIAAAREAARTGRDEAFSAVLEDTRRAGAAIVAAAETEADAIRTRDPAGLDRAAGVVAAAAMRAAGTDPPDVARAPS